MIMVDKNEDETIGGTGSNPSSPVRAEADTSKPQSPPEGGLAARLAEALEHVVPEKNAASAREPVILEEHVIEKAPQNATAEDVGLILPKPSPEVSVSLTPKPVPPPAPPEPLVMRPTTNLPPIKETISAPSALPPERNPASGDITTDIQKILSQVKLPERRDFKAAADQKQQSSESTPPINMQGLVKRPPQSEEAARAMMSKPEAAPLSSVRTLKDDLQHVVKEKKMSLVRAVSLEQDKKRTEFVEEEFGRKTRRKRVAGIVFTILLLFGMGVAALAGVYFVVLSHSATDAQSLNSLVFAEQSVALPLDNASPAELKRRLAGARNTQTGSLGSITRIVPLLQTPDGAQQVQATTQQFFAAMGFNAPEDLTRSLDTVFFFGLHTVDKNAPVLVIPVINYEHAFAGMLAWESSMNADLSPVFTAVPTTVLDANGVPSARVFIDDVLRNYDVRELKDDSGTVELYYSFPNKNLLIIAESPYSFPELLSRLQSVRRL